MPTPQPHGRAFIRAHRPAVDAALYAALAVLAAVFGVTGLWSVFSVLAPGASAWWTLVAALPAAALVLLRERAPLVGLALVAILLVADVLTVSGIVPMIAALDLLYAGVVRASPAARRRILVVIVLVATVAAVAAGIGAADPRAGLLMALQSGGLLGVSYWWGMSTAQAGELVTLHRQRAEDALRLAERDRRAAVEHERETMARELHDLVAGHVSAVAIRAEAALVAPGHTATDAAALRAVRDSSLHAHEALRSMIAVLRTGDEPFVSAPGRAAVPDMVREAERSGLSVRLHDSISEPLPAALDQAAARIVQEALANCARYAAGGSVDVRLASAGDGVAIRIDSRGGEPLGAPALPGSGWGLDLLRERARALGGWLEAGPAGEGWRVHAQLPKEVPV